MKHNPQVASGMKESSTTEASNKLLGTLVFVVALWLWLKTKSELEYGYQCPKKFAGCNRVVILTELVRETQCIPDLLQNQNLPDNL